MQIEIFNDSKIYIMDNFYKYPEAILNYLMCVKEPTLWKAAETPSYNGQHFLDLRHSFDSAQFEKIGIQLSTICGHTAPAPGTVKTNCVKFIDKHFNDYANNYWAPHRDMGYTALIYLNSVATATNLYAETEPDVWHTPEHYAPWRSKQKYAILKQLQGQFNRLIMFDGAKFLHGMDICDDAFFNCFRINQVLFFRPSLTCDK